ncbi:MAG TPA: superoxide dismutase family protein [Paracoccaceae bacterium]|nr:superoxide dismutase family protein [Paracoccaceae bacterium]
MTPRHAPLVLASALLAAPAAMAQDAPTARATLENADGMTVGQATLRELPAGLLVMIDVQDLPPGAHGFHIHETGACSPDFQAAGGHFAPQNRPHGFAASRLPHPGDMPNLHVTEDGRARAEILNARATLHEGPTAILDDDGAALMVHAAPDDHRDVDSAGGRIACGVIESDG